MEPEGVLAHWDLHDLIAFCSPDVREVRRGVPHAERGWLGWRAIQAYYGGGEELPDQEGRMLSPPRPWWLPL